MIQPVIFEYLDAVQFLNAHFQWRRTNDPKFSIARWAQDMGFDNDVTLRFILKGRRLISGRSVLLFTTNLRLTEKEAQFFDVLVSYSQSTKTADKQAFGRALVHLQRDQFRQSVVAPDPASRHALVPVILTLMTFDDLKKDSRTIADILMLNEGVVSSVLKRMNEDGLISQSADGNTYTYEISKFRINDNPNLVKFYEYWIEKSKEALELPFNLRRYRSLKFSLSEEEFAEIIERLNDHALVLLSKYQSSSISGKRLYMYQNSIFPISKLVETSAEELQTNINSGEG